MTRVWSVHAMRSELMSDGKDIIRVICCGNPFRGDDGVGLDVFRLLKKEAFPEQVEIVEGGILGINLLSLFNDCKKVIIVDSVLMDKPSGHIQWFSMTDILETKPAKISSHEITPSQLMALWYQLDNSALSKLLLLGIVISAPTHLTDTMSPEVQHSAIKAVDEIKHKIRRFVAHGKS